MPVQTFRFNFKTRVLRDEAGNEIGRSRKQPSLDVALPVLSEDDVIRYLASPDTPAAKLLMGQINDLIYSAARRQFDDIIESFGDSDAEINAGMLDVSKLAVDHLASIPAAQRGVSAITDEEWEFFYADYIATLVPATGKTEAVLQNHISVFKKPMRYKSARPILDTLCNDLNVYIMKSTALDDTGVCAQRLLTKFQRWLADIDQPLDRNAF